MTISTIECEPIRQSPSSLLGAGAWYRASQQTLPCQVNEAELWFSAEPAEVEQAKALCGACPAREACLQAALDRAEPWGVWGAELFDSGMVIPRKRPRGRPRKQSLAC